MKKPEVIVLWHQIILARLQATEAGVRLRSSDDLKLLSVFDTLNWEGRCNGMFQKNIAESAPMMASDQLDDGLS